MENPQPVRIEAMGDLRNPQETLEIIQMEHQNEELVPEEDSLSDIDPNHDSLLEESPKDTGGYSSIGREMENNFLFNPIPCVDNATGDIPWSASYLYGLPTIIPDQQTLEANRYIEVISADLDKGKRKREDSLETTEVCGLKVQVRETGQGS